MKRKWENYSEIIADFLRVWSAGAPREQRFLVSGHIAAAGGYQLVGTQQLRIASGAHAEPLTAARYLLLDCAQPVPTISKLVSGLCRRFPDKRKLRASHPSIPAK